MSLHVEVRLYSSAAEPDSLWVFRVQGLGLNSAVESDRIRRFAPLVYERWGAGVETQKNVRGEIGGWGRVPFNETYAPSLSTIYDGA